MSTKHLPDRQRRIVSAAMLMHDGAIITGIRHFSPEMRATLKRCYGAGLRIFGRWWIKPYHLHVKEQGFVDQFGVFLNREDAWVVAEQAGQILRRVATPGELYSENLY